MPLDERYSLPFRYIWYRPVDGYLLTVGYAHSRGIGQAPPVSFSQPPLTLRPVSVIYAFVALRRVPPLSRPLLVLRSPGRVRIA